MQFSEPKQVMIDRKRRNRMAQIDALPFEWRELVHQYGYATIKALRDAKVTKAAIARHLIVTITREQSAVLGSFSQQGGRGDVEGIQ